MKPCEANSPISEHDHFVAVIPVCQGRAARSTFVYEVPIVQSGTYWFASYVGLEYERAFGGTADFRRAAGEGAGGGSLLFGLRTWF